MTPLTNSLIVLACVFSSALVGMYIRARLPASYLDNDTGDVIKLALGLIVMMSALLLGLLISTAKSSYDLMRVQLTQLGADVILMDRSLALYGSETKDARNNLRDLAENLLYQLELFRGNRSRPESPQVKAGAKNFYQSIRALVPRDSGQGSPKDEAVRVSFAVAEIRALALARESNSIPVPFLVILAFWLAVLFAGFGFFAPPNCATVTALAICALSVSVAIFLILQMNQLLTGLIRISLEPLRNAIDARASGVQQDSGVALGKRLTSGIRVYIFHR